MSASLIFTLECVLAHLALSRSPKLFRTLLVTESFDFSVAPLAEKLFAEEKLIGKLYRKSFFWVAHGWFFLNARTHFSSPFTSSISSSVQPAGLF